MKLAFSVAIIGLLAVPLVLGRGERGEDDVAASPGGQEMQSHYRLTVPGMDDSCTVAKGAALGLRRAELEMQGDCGALLPRLEEARYWKEKANGDVVLADANGRAIAEFYAADGVAYESVKPAMPLMALTVQ